VVVYLDMIVLMYESWGNTSPLNGVSPCLCEYRYGCFYSIGSLEIKYIVYACDDLLSNLD
jgi:hypothetical protein